MTFEQYSLLWDDGYRAFISGEDGLSNLHLYDYEQAKAWLMGYYSAKENNNAMEN